MGENQYEGQNLRASIVDHIKRLTQEMRRTKDDWFVVPHRCEICRFWKQYKKEDCTMWVNEMARRGLCRQAPRYEPHDKDDWCGKYDSIEFIGVVMKKVLEEAG